MMGTRSFRNSDGSVLQLAFLVLCWVLAAQAAAHGAHANFLSPAEGAVIEDELLVHVKRAGASFPYIYLSVRQQASSEEMWGGLVEIGDEGYAQSIDLNGWQAGRYVLEVQFLGDTVEQKSQRLVLIGSP